MLHKRSEEIDGADDAIGVGEIVKDDEVIIDGGRVDELLAGKNSGEQTDGDGAGGFGGGDVGGSVAEVETPLWIDVDAVGFRARRGEGDELSSIGVVGTETAKPRRSEILGDAEPLHLGPPYRF